MVIKLMYGIRKVYRRLFNAETISEVTDVAIYTTR